MNQNSGPLMLSAMFRAPHLQVFWEITMMVLAVDCINFAPEKVESYLHHQYNMN
jgi:hypothetical protein